MKTTPLSHGMWQEVWPHRESPRSSTAKRPNMEVGDSRTVSDCSVKRAPRPKQLGRTGGNRCRHIGTNVGHEKQPGARQWFYRPSCPFFHYPFFSLQGDLVTAIRH